MRRSSRSAREQRRKSLVAGIVGIALAGLFPIFVAASILWTNVYRRGQLSTLNLKNSARGRDGALTATNLLETFMPALNPMQVRRVFISIGAVALVSFGAVALVIAASTLPQGLNAVATPVAAPATEVNALRRRVDELERRIRELEKTQAGSIELGEEGSAVEKKLEQRLSAIEAAQQTAAATDKSAKNTTAVGFDPLNVPAPFVVRDENGKPIFRVDRSPTTGYARAILGEVSKASAALVAVPQGGVLQLIDATGTVKVSASGQTDVTGVRVHMKTGDTFMGKSSDGQSVVQVLNVSSYAVAELRGMSSQSGQLVLANQAGSNMVVAGMTTKGVGIVKTGPGGMGPAAAMGNGGQPASEITGKIR